MSDRSTFTADEWLALRLAPALVGAGVMASSPDGVLAALKESVAMGTASFRALDRFKDVALLKALATDRDGVTEGLKSALGTGDFASRATEVRATALRHVTQAITLLRAKGDAREAEAYASWLTDLAAGVAGASSESGGFLGFGGEKISDAERAFMAELAGALAPAGTIASTGGTEGASPTT
jgi:hypothetical protein